MKFIKKGASKDSLGLATTTTDNAIIRADGTTGNTQNSDVTISDGPAVTITGGAGNMTILAGTGNSRTMTLQVSNGVGTPTTWISGNANGNTTIAGTTTMNGSATFVASCFESVDTRTGAGAVSITTLATKLVTTAADALTLADGTNGQIKRVTMITDGGDGTLTPTTKTGFATITFTAVGNSVTLQFYTTQGWMILSNYGCTIA